MEIASARPYRQDRPKRCKVIEENSIRVTVYLPPYLKDNNVDSSGRVALGESATVGDLFRLLKVPFPAVAVRFCRVNYEKASLTTRLKDGDTIGFYSLVSGG